MTTLCGVCNQEPSKYKCPSCQLQYCSLNCFKSHKTTHETETPKTNPPPSPAPAPPPTAPPAPVPASASTSSNPPAPPTLPLTALPTHPTLQALFTRHPTLRTQLRTIYTATLEPTRDRPTHTRYIRGAHRGLTGRHRNRPMGPWTQEIGDKYAVKLLKDALAVEGREGEGVREFVGFVTGVCGERVEGEVGT